MKFLPLLFTVFLDSLGFGLVFPIFSPLIMGDSSQFLAPDVSVATRGWIIGILISSFCLGQFFGGPILGAISDRKGRKKILILSIALGMMGYLTAAAGVLIHSVTVLLLGRVVSGVAAGNWSIAQSAMADCSTNDEKTKNFGLIGMAWGTGFILGPYLGGKIADPVMVSWVAAGLCALNLLLVWWRFKETLPAVQLSEISLWTGIRQMKKVFGIPQLRAIFTLMFVFSVGWGFFTEFSPLFLMSYFQFDMQGIGNFYACVGLWIALSQGLLIRPFVKRFSSEKLLIAGLLGLGLLLPLMLFLKGGLALFWTIPIFSFFEALIGPSASTIVSNLTSKENQGEVLGILSSVQFFAIGISPFFSGSFVAMYPYLPVSVGGLMMFLSIGVYYWMQKKLSPETDSKNETFS